MSKKKFNPKDWATVGTDLRVCPKPNNCPNNPHNDIETITARIEATAIDIAPNYADWRDLGFALADALGESGRTYYHRLSSFYPKYNQTETDKQYNNCLKAHGHGVTIKTLYHLAKSAGVDVSVGANLRVCPKPKQTKSPNPPNGDLGDMEEIEEKPLPTIPEKLYQDLPDFLQRATAKATSAEDKDLLLLGSLVAISPCLPNIYGIYAERNVYPNLFLFVTAQASAGKGRLTLCRKLVEPIHRALREQSKAEQQEYQRQLTEYSMAKDKTDMERPQEPPLKMLIIPANNSATGLFQILNDNKGIWLIFETEGDTLAQTFKSEHGNYSDGFRKAFHHEKISYLRRKDREYVTLEIPKLSALLSGTPRQIQSLIPDAENGLFSRFMFYYMNIRLQWIDVFACNENESLDQRFNRFGDVFFDFYRTLKQTDTIRFSLSTNQQKQFFAYFESTQQQYWELFGQDFIGTVRRLGLITFRIAMVLTVLRIMENGEIGHTLVCSDTDFQITMEIVKVLIQHAAFVFRQLPQATTVVPPTRRWFYSKHCPPNSTGQNTLKWPHNYKFPKAPPTNKLQGFVMQGY
jgi:hypothetical protein